MTEKTQGFVPQAENLLRYTANLDRTALSLIIGLEQSVMTRPTGSITDDLPKLHRKWLDTHEHTNVDEIDYHIMQLLWAILRSRPGQYRDSVEMLSACEEKDLLSTANYSLLLNVLEVGGKYAEPEQLNLLFERLRPDDDKRMVDYCNFLGGKLRAVDQNQQRAAEVLRQGRELIEKLGLTGTVQEAANDSRMAYTLADMGLWSETLPLMRRVMDNMKTRGYADDSPTVTPIRSTYHFFLSKCGEYQQTRKELGDHLKNVLEKDERFEAVVRAYTSYLRLLMDHDEFEEGEKIARNLIAYCRGCVNSDPELEGEAFLAGGRVLLLCSKPAEAIGLLAEAQGLFENVDEGSVLQCRFYTSRCLAALGHTEKASAMLKNVHNMLLKRHEGNRRLLTLVEQAEAEETK